MAAFGSLVCCRRDDMSLRTLPSMSSCHARDPDFGNHPTLAIDSHTNCVGGAQLRFFRRVAKPPVIQRARHAINSRHNDRSQDDKEERKQRAALSSWLPRSDDGGWSQPENSQRQTSFVTKAAKAAAIALLLAGIGIAAINYRRPLHGPLRGAEATAVATPTAPGLQMAGEGSPAGREGVAEEEPSVSEADVEETGEWELAEAEAGFGIPEDTEEAASDSFSVSSLGGSAVEGKDRRGSKLVGIRIGAVVDKSQARWLDALQSIGVVEEGVVATDVCTRGEYASWLMASTTKLTTDPTARVLPPMFVEGGAVRLASYPAVYREPVGSLRGILCSVQTDVCSPLSREDLLTWKVALTHRHLPPPDVEVLQSEWGLLDVEDASDALLSSLIADLAAGEDSVTATAFGFTRRFQPSQVVTHQQAAASLAVGRAVGVVNPEADRLEESREWGRLVAREEAMVERMVELQEEAAEAGREREEVGWVVERETERLGEVEEEVERGRREVEEEREAMRELEEELYSFLRSRRAERGSMEEEGERRREELEKLRTERVRLEKEVGELEAQWTTFVEKKRELQALHRPYVELREHAERTSVMAAQQANQIAAARSQVEAAVGVERREWSERAKVKARSAVTRLHPRVRPLLQVILFWFVDAVRGVANIWQRIWVEMGVGCGRVGDRIAFELQPVLQRVKAKVGREVGGVERVGRQVKGEWEKRWGQAASKVENGLGTKRG